METPRIIYPIAKASLILAFCASLNTGALADERSTTNARNQSKRAEVEHRVKRPRPQGCRSLQPERR